jgi:DNA-directed RNA polymerase specialized sigma24 family protein
MVESKSRAEIFNQYRPRLFGIAYRMLGTRADSEDVIQEAYLRWHKADAESIETPEAWLVTVTTRLSIDRCGFWRKSAKRISDRGSPTAYYE